MITSSDCSGGIKKKSCRLSFNCDNEHAVILYINLYFVYCTRKKCTVISCNINLYWFLSVVELQNKLILSCYKLVSVYWKLCLRDSFADGLQMTSTRQGGRQRLMWNTATFLPPSLTSISFILIASVWCSHPCGNVADNTHAN